ncbi:MAG: glycosyl hydrolase-related protein, partial [Akkermansiaceae bacterium]
MHTFSYAIFPHAGSLQDGGVIEESYAFNVPLHVVNATAGDETLPSEKSFLSVDRPGVFIEAVKPAEKSNRAVVRLYEGYNTRGNVTLQSDTLKGEAQEVDLLENPLADKALETSGQDTTLSVKPFEIRTLAWD